MGVSPTLFDSHRTAGPTSKDSDIGNGTGNRKKAMTANIRLSTRINVERLLVGRTDYEDQYPDEMGG